MGSFKGLITRPSMADCTHGCRMHFWWQIFGWFIGQFFGQILERFFSEQSTISSAHSGQLRGALLVDLRRLTACMVAECIFGNRFVWQFFWTDFERMLDRFFLNKVLSPQLIVGSFKGLTSRPSTADCLHGCRMHFWWQIYLTIFLDRFWTNFRQILDRFWKNWTGFFWTKYYLLSS